MKITTEKKFKQIYEPRFAEECEGCQCLPFTRGIKIATWIIVAVFASLFVALIIIDKSNGERLMNVIRPIYHFTDNNVISTIIGCILFVLFICMFGFIHEMIHALCDYKKSIIIYRFSLFAPTASTYMGWQGKGKELWCLIAPLAVLSVIIGAVGAATQNLMLYLWLMSLNIWAAGSDIPVFIYFALKIPPNSEINGLWYRQRIIP